MKKILFNMLTIFPYLLVLFASLYSPSDPDLGWHLKYGEHFFKTGQILRDNTFSAMMPDYKWANISWGTDVVTYAIFDSLGFLGLTIAGALLVSITFFFFSKAARLSLWDKAILFPLLLYLVTPINAVSFRGQQISMLLLGVLCYLASRYEERKKIIYLVIPLFLFWSNLHGQFILGLGVLAMWILGRLLVIALENKEDRKILANMKKNLFSAKNEVLSLVLLFALSILATAINPFGIGIHLASLEHFGNPLLKSVGEYLPFTSLSKEWWNQVVIAVALAGSAVYFYFKKELLTKLPYISPGAVFYLLSFSVRRFAWPAYYLVVFLLKPLSGFLRPDKKKTQYITAFVWMLIFFTHVVFSKTPLSKFAEYGWDDYCRQAVVSCSPESADFIIENRLNTGNLYSLYAWGGYLLWNYPEIKPLIDGRMHIWRDEKGYSGFEEYYGYEQNFKDIDESEYEIVYMSPEKPIYKRMIELVNSGKWKIVYEDPKAGIFVRK
jgi:hypothetical protein